MGQSLYKTYNLNQKIYLFNPVSKNVNVVQLDDQVREYHLRTKS